MMSVVVSVTSNFLTSSCIALLALTASCSKSYDSESYLKYLNDPSHGLVKEFKRENFSISCSYKPSQVMAIQQAGLQSGGLPEARTEKDEYEANIYCLLKFSVNGRDVENAFIQNEELYSNCIRYLSGGVYNDVSLCVNHDTLPAVASIYARQYGSSNSSSVLVVFPRGQIDLRHGFDIIYQGDKFGIGPVRFPFTADAIKNIPDLPY